MRVALLALGFVSLVGINGCGDDKDKAKTGSADVTLTNGTAAFALAATPTGSSGTVTTHGTTLQAYPATTYATKLVQIYLNEDLGEDGWSNKGQVGYIWVNPACGTNTSEEGYVTIGNNGNCDTTQITTYFELARTSAAVNADLNSQAIPIPVGTYRYARVQLCDSQVPDKNLKIATRGAGLNTVTAVRTGNCVMEPVKIDPPVTVGEGTSINVSLRYDLQKAIVDYWYNISSGTYTSGGSVPEYCVAAESGFSGVRCARDMDFIATVTTK